VWTCGGRRRDRRRSIFAHSLFLPPPLFFCSQRYPQKLPWTADELKRLAERCMFCGLRFPPSLSRPGLLQKPLSPFAWFLRLSSAFSPIRKAAMEAIICGRRFAIENNCTHSNVGTVSHSFNSKYSSCLHMRSCSCQKCFCGSDERRKVRVRIYISSPPTIYHLFLITPSVKDRRSKVGDGITCAVFFWTSFSHLRITGRPACVWARSRRRTKNQKTCERVKTSYERCRPSARCQKLYHLIR
jgi:hypothetical protein